MIFFDMRNFILQEVYIILYLLSNYYCIYYEELFFFLIKGNFLNDTTIKEILFCKRCWSIYYRIIVVFITRNYILFFFFN